MEDGTETELEDSADAAETETENRAARRSRSPRRAALPSSSSSGAPTSDVRARHAHAWDAAEAARRHQLRHHLLDVISSTPYAWRIVTALAMRETAAHFVRRSSGLGTRRGLWSR